MAAKYNRDRVAWWLCSPGNNDNNAACVNGDNGNVNDNGNNVKNTLGVRPALKLNLESVIFLSESKTFTVGSAKTDQTVTAPTAASNLTYTGSAQTLISSVAQVTKGNTSGSITYSLNGTNYSADLPTGTDAGTYNVYYKVAGNDDYNEFVSTSPVSVSIGKATPTVTAPTAPNPTYMGTAQNLITAGMTTGGVIQYSLDGSNYSTTIPQGTDKQEYTVYYKVVGNGNYNDVAVQTVKSTISDKPSASITTAPQAKTLTYNGDAQELVTSGSVAGGTMYYAVTTINTAPTDNLYTTSIPTETNAGTYYVWYKVEGDGNQKGTDPQKLEIEIVLIPSLAGGRVTAPAGAKLILARYVILENSKDRVPVMTSVKGTVIAEDCAKADPAVLLGLSKTPIRGCKLLLLDPETGSPLCEAWEPGS